ncbi:molybdopterin-binding protein [Bradyrhizobium sp. LHD-71]|uniref:molybdopterin-binding protein n=1 Tax=Bradyrhizobium sp. LHD-71 TaxID=3072141 RepID=UPI00280FCCF9|nr:molybdopterin-binding protein [Bradyrhizobium sp. LHD-71]MDQ8731447.1 molybdopterin-binding protein [Bradyrhizobium sp. LHD-71]
MTGPQRPTAALTSLDSALANLLECVRAVAPVDCLLENAVGAVAAGALQRAALPPHNTAMVDGWAMRAHDLVGASSYAPVLLQTAPVWVEAGDRLPPDCDCVLDENSVVQSAPLFEALAEAIPGEGVRRAGEDMAEGSGIVAAGQRIGATDLMIARSAGCDRLSVRRPIVRVLEVPAGDKRSTSAEFIAASAREAGARVMLAKADARDAQSIASAIGGDACDLLLIVGGSGVGRNDAAVAALAARGDVVAHGLALRPGRTAAVGRIGPTPVIVIPGTPSHALAAWLGLAQPVLDRLTMRMLRHPIVRPLARKIASAIGFSELVLLKAVDGDWRPLATGDLPLQQIATADAWLIVPAESEGYAAGAHIGALPL